MNIKTTLTACCVAALIAGCATDDTGEQKFLSEREQKAVLARSKTPQYFGYSAFPLPDGSIGFNGEARLHPNHMISAEFIKGSVPVIKMQGKARRQRFNALFDPSTLSSWLEFNTAADLGAVFLGMSGQNFPYSGINNTGQVNAYAAVVSQMRIEQFFLDNIPVYVRMASGSIGPLARGVQSPNVDAVIGWDLLRQMEYIQFDFRNNGVTLSATHPYMPHQDLLMTEARIVDQRGYGLAVQGAIEGQPTPIILDLAHESHFWRGDQRVNQTKQVSIGDVVFRKVPTMLMPPNTSPPRAGRSMLEPYIITICPRLGVVYFERFPE